MRAALAAAAIAVLWSAIGAAAQADESVALDAARSHARFSITHVYVQRVDGSVPIAGGSVVFASGSALPAKITATLDARRVDTGNGDRDDDLQGPDWFDTRKYPTWTFSSTAVRPGANGAFAVEGALTVHGVAQPVVLAVTPANAGGRTVYHAVAKLDRRAFGMKVTPIDGLLGSDVDVTLDITLAR